MTANQLLDSRHKMLHRQYFLVITEVIIPFLRHFHCSNIVVAHTIIQNYGKLIYKIYMWPYYIFNDVASTKDFMYVNIFRALNEN